jgi:hypothetical protein
MHFWKKPVTAWVPLIIAVTAFIGTLMITLLGMDNTTGMEDADAQFKLQQFYQGLYYVTVVMYGFGLFFSIMLLVKSGRKVLPIIGLIINGAAFLFYLAMVSMILIAVLAGFGLGGQG